MQNTANKLRQEQTKASVFGNGIMIFAAVLMVMFITTADAGKEGLKVGTILKWQLHELPHINKSNEQIITDGSPHEYNITMGGTVDMDHGITRGNSNWDIGWQPNESLTIANIGSVPVENAKIIINQRGNWYTIEEMLDEALATAKSDQEKVYLIWQFVRLNRFHDLCLYQFHYIEEHHDPVKFLTIYAGSICDDAGSIGASLYQAAGLTEQEPFVGCFHGHEMCEVFNESHYQFMDSDVHAFYLDRENELPVSSAALARDHDLVHREISTYGSVLTPLYNSRNIAALYGRDDGRTTRQTRGHQIRVNLRAGERIEYRWDNIGKWSMYREYTRIWVGNSRRIYEPQLDTPNAGATKAENISLIKLNGQAAVTADNNEASLTYRMNSSYVFCGGRINAAFKLADANDKVIIEAWAQDNKGKGKTESVILWQSEGAGTQQADFEIDSAIDPTHGRPEYEFFVRVRLSSNSGKGGAVLTHLAIRGDIMVSPIFLPRLKLGENKVVYTDDSSAERKVCVTYNWRETMAAKPLAPPTLAYPANESMIRDEILTYKWQPVEGAKAYHLQVARDKDFRWPYRPGLDVNYKEKPEHSIPSLGLYSPKTTYYWRICTKNDKGIWGDWSEPSTFTWTGPRVPLKVKLMEKNGLFTLFWQPNPRGEKPVSYEIYASDIKGFSISKTSYPVRTLGEVPGNFLGQITDNEIIVSGYLDSNNLPTGVTNPENLNRCYYRVVAIDAHGTRSGPSNYTEMPHPFIYTPPVTIAKVGQPYRYQPLSISSMGDFQRRDHKLCKQFWDKELLEFKIEQGPEWLKIDSKSGLLTGTPPATAAGDYNICLRVIATYDERPAIEKIAGGHYIRLCEPGTHKPHSGVEVAVDELHPRFNLQSYKLIVGK
ncbi:MAG: Ig domain-containing protein [Anaerohalosphaeraceae bacterium]|nr:Ig domain-containing protein [Anaerohalosphaeraceae bacterium]